MEAKHKTEYKKRKAYFQKYYLEHREELQQYYKGRREQRKVTLAAWRDKNRAKNREKNYRWKHDNWERYVATQRRSSLAKCGFTLELFNKRRLEQDNCCAICGIELNDAMGTGRISADHNHKTMQPRGILCGRCNTGIGMLQENPEILQSAIDYINKWNSSE